MLGVWFGFLATGETVYGRFAPLTFAHSPNVSSHGRFDPRMLHPPTGRFTRFSGCFTLTSSKFPQTQRTYRLFHRFFLRSRMKCRSSSANRKLLIEFYVAYLCTSSSLNWSLKITTNAVITTNNTQKQYCVVMSGAVRCMPARLKTHRLCQCMDVHRLETVLTTV